MGYWYLAIAIIAEVIATSALKASGEFTKLVPSIIVVTGYGVAFYFLALVLRTIPVGVAYAIWSGMGIVLIAIVASIFFQTNPRCARVDWYDSNNIRRSGYQRFFQNNKQLILNNSIKPKMNINVLIT